MIVRRIRPHRHWHSWESPFHQLEHMRHEVDRLFHALSSSARREPGTGVFPAMNVTQDADNFYARAELPGVKASDLEISALGNKLTLSGKREIPAESESVSYHRREREEGSFNRSITLPSQVDVERVEATYTNGILTITLPKTEAAKPKQIAIRTA